MVWRAGVVFVCLFAVGAGTACAAEVLACETQSVAWDRREYRCPLTANSNPRQLRFKADFAGSHDDTDVSMTLTLDGVPVACSKGSKTSLYGEDGDVSLECYLAVDGTAGTKRMLGAAVRFRHAQFVAVELSTP